jgi:putative transposase
MIESEPSSISIVQQCRLLKVPRSSFYYQHQPINPEDLDLMKLIDAQYLKTPCWGSRSMRNHLRRLGYTTLNRKRVQRLMRIRGLEAIYPNPKTSRPHPEHKVYPYLLRDLEHPAPQSGMGGRYNLYPDAPGFYVSCCGHGLV